ncbi:hypothetical protein KGF57_000206 [Candida theae]|uniref:DUF676 domain-containing protein n=1 Tax=Candida theae TaxID=1198502 RepID=A0AAD5BJC3_9ASCO|nr:uncharacterized protein KGF57_000206 [Candida theae]KAI5968347.1 hypothetical protein KGF57_000206 [Candida theae]
MSSDATPITTADTTKDLNKEGGKSAHLFVLIHGLWGSPNHMRTIERYIKESLPPTTTDVIATLKPASFRFWKTYDGLDLNSRKIITEIFYEIESLREKNGLTVTKISFIGYSLGGLFSRYVIGLLNELGFFEQVEPVFFSTFATPHMGVEFFRDNIFDNIANIVGPYLFGKSGGQLFLADKEQVLVKLADHKQIFYQGLVKFQKHTLLANVRNDRTVAFFTSFITSYSPFDEFDLVKIKYLKNLPETKIAGKLVRPKVVDLARSHKLAHTDSHLFPGNLQEETPFVRKNKYARILVIVALVMLIVPLWIPFILTTSTIVSVYSFIKVRVHKLPDIAEHWSRVVNYVYKDKPMDPQDAEASQKQREKRRRLAQQESFKGDTSHITENAMEGMLYAEEHFMHRSKSAGSVIPEVDENNDDSEAGEDTKRNGSSLQQIYLDSRTSTKLVDIDFEANDEIVRKQSSILQDNSRISLFTKESELKLDDQKIFIMNSLNEIKWIKIPVFLDVWNSHDGIVSRRGPKTNPKGAATIGVWVSILRTHLQDENGDKNKS